MRKRINNLVRRINKGIRFLTSPQNHYFYSKNLYSHHSLSFSQEGEDLIIKRMFEGQEKGFYVDVGAHHPRRFSNTYLFYLNEWKGINIDAMPNSMTLFNATRPRDINLEIPISDKPDKITYYAFNEPALNSFQKDLADQYVELGYEILFEVELSPQTLSDVLDKYLPENQTIDFLSIDVEGLDFQVLKSNNWSKYRPKIILVEDLASAAIKQIMKSEIYSFLESQNYSLHAKTVNTLFFIDNC